MVLKRWKGQNYFFFCKNKMRVICRSCIAENGKQAEKNGTSRVNIKQREKYHVLNLRTRQATKDVNMFTPCVSLSVDGATSTAKATIFCLLFSIHYDIIIVILVPVLIMLPSLIQVPIYKTMTFIVKNKPLITISTTEIKFI